MRKMHSQTTNNVLLYSSLLKEVGRSRSAASRTRSMQSRSFEVGGLVDLEVDVEVVDEVEVEVVGAVQLPPI